ncbi:lymphocyte antigen 6E isoform X3 [Mustela putorius furo]|uniref:Lymphocyte antigen 6E isoform X3 n=1 Tax=Mustela putorius furo TaxID=9669 RepID=A0A8U0RS87_MUSPF|nr:lymphocyte antigen 6E isoform X3 [Mustela putorius furo]
MTRAPRGDEKDQPGGLATPPWGWAPGPSWGACQPRPGLKSDPARAPPPGMPAPRPPAGAPTPALLLLPSAPERQLCAARPFAPSSPCAPSPLEPRLRPCSPRPLEPRLRPCFPRPRERRLRPLSPARRRGHESGAFVRLGARLGELGETVDLRLPHPVPRLSPVRPVWLHAWPGTVGTPDVTGGCAYQSFLENSSELPQIQTSHSRRGSWGSFLRRCPHLEMGSALNSGIRSSCPRPQGRKWRNSRFYRLAVVSAESYRAGSAPSLRNTEAAGGRCPVPSRPLSPHGRNGKFWMWAG